MFNRNNSSGNKSNKRTVLQTKLLCPALRMLLLPPLWVAMRVLTCSRLPLRLVMVVVVVLGLEVARPLRTWTFSAATPISSN